jgi:hypothetical protein
MQTNHHNMPPRRALGENFRDQTRKKEISPAMGGIIIGKCSEGAAYAKIYRDTGITVSTTKDTVNKATSRLYQQSLKRAGRPQITTDRVERRILKTAPKEPTREWKFVLNDINEQFSKSTVYRVLRKHHIAK